MVTLQTPPMSTAEVSAESHPTFRADFNIERARAGAENRSGLEKRQNRVLVYTCSVRQRKEHTDSNET
jgi:hypothetical protein